MTGKPRAHNPAAPSGNMIADSALGLVPETLASYLHYNRMIWEEGPLSPAEVEVARLRNARRVNCVFCKSVRYDIAIEAGLTEERVAMIGEGYRDSGLSAREKLIVALVDQYYDAPGSMSESLRAELDAEFSAEELAHLSLAIAHFSGFSRCAVALGGMPEELPVMAISLPDG